jgi:hypothetical protein
MSSETLAEIQQDPTYLYFKRFLKEDDSAQTNLSFDLNAFAAKKKLDADFQLKDLAMSGHITLMDASKKYGSLLIAFNKSLLVLSNKTLGTMLMTGNLPADFESIISVSYSEGLTMPNLCSFSV